MLTRRKLVTNAAALVASAAALRSFKSPARAEISVPMKVQRAGAAPLLLEIAERPTALPCFGGAKLPLWTFQDGSDFPVLRVRAGERFEAIVKNGLTRPGEHVTIHWHGLRIPNREDGVAYLTQDPIQPGTEGRYAFTPPDTGTYFFHTHCNSVEHFGRGLVGVLIVEGDEVAPSDHELVLLMKDWRLSPDKAFLPFTTDEGAAKAGTAGTVRAINGITKPVYAVPASANVRMRLLNVDPARISEIGIEGADAAIIAVDGNPCAPIKLDSWRFGPSQRLDILMRSPKAGETVKLIDYFSVTPVVLAEFTAEGKPLRRDRFSAKPLKYGRARAADRKIAERVPFEFSATATGKAIADLAQAGIGLEIGSLCLSKRSFWAINKQAWSNSDNKMLGPPLAHLKKGNSYIFELKNLTPHAHPIHIHGHTFEVLTSSLRKILTHRADTVLLLPKERLEIAFVADNPGKWMFHCHILEHQETGMMGHFDVA